MHTFVSFSALFCPVTRRPLSPVGERPRCVTVPKHGHACWMMFSICKEQEHNFQKQQNIALLYLNLRKKITQKCSIFDRAPQELSSRKMQAVGGLRSDNLCNSFLSFGHQICTMVPGVLSRDARNWGWESRASPNRFASITLFSSAQISWGVVQRPKFLPHYMELLT